MKGKVMLTLLCLFYSLVLILCLVCVRGKYGTGNLASIFGFTGLILNLGGHVLR